MKMRITPGSLREIILSDCVCFTIRQEKPFVLLFLVSYKGRWYQRNLQVQIMHKLPHIAHQAGKEGIV